MTSFFTRSLPIIALVAVGTPPSCATNDSLPLGSDQAATLAQQMVNYTANGAMSTGGTNGVYFDMDRVSFNDLHKGTNNTTRFTLRHPWPKSGVVMCGFDDPYVGSADVIKNPDGKTYYVSIKVEGERPYTILDVEQRRGQFVYPQLAPASAPTNNQRSQNELPGREDVGYKLGVSGLSGVLIPG